MMSKRQRWPETSVSSKNSKPTQKTEGKELAASATVVSSGGKQAGSKTNVSYKRSNSLNSRGNDLTATGSKTGTTLKKGSITQHSSTGQQGTRPASRSARVASRLSSSRSFSSLHSSSLAAAPFMRSSRSLNRLDQRPTDSDAVSGSKAKKEPNREKKAQNCGQLSPSEEQIRDKNYQFHSDHGKEVVTSSSSEPQDYSSSLVSFTESHHHCNKVKKQTRDGMFTLCAMTAGMKRNLVQAVLKNVRPSVTPDVTSSLPEQTTQQKSQHPQCESAKGLEKDGHPNGFLQDPKTSDCAEEPHQEQKEQKLRVQPEGEQSSPDGSSASSMGSISLLSSSIGPSPPPSPLLCLLPDCDGASCDQCTRLVASRQPGVTDALECTEGPHSSVLLNNKCCNEHPNTEQQEKPIHISCGFTKEKEKLPCDQQTVQLVKELEHTQRDLSRLQLTNKNLQDELRRERESHSSIINELLSNSSGEQVSALRQLQKMNHDLRFELEVQKRSQEEAREAELRRRVDLLAQQAQLLVTGDATALAQAQIEQERKMFLELQVEWERSDASLKSQLGAKEEQRKEAETKLTQLQQELQSFHSLQQEADRLQEHLREVTTQLHSTEEAQSQKEARLQKHLLLLQGSQDRERRSLAMRLAQAEQISQDLQERLDQATQQVVSLTETQRSAKDVEKAQYPLQEELVGALSAVEKLQEEMGQLNRQCQELQNHLSERDGEVSRLQNCLKTDETHYYNLEHSHERVCEELQLALGMVQQKESETQEMREGYERVLDKKEQELIEVLLKMEVLGNSLEETEVKLNEMLNVCTCASSWHRNEQQQPSEQHLMVNNNRPKTAEPNATEYVRSHSHPTDPSYQSIEGDDPEKFISVIKQLETKLYITEDKLRDIMQRLGEQQSHIPCQDPHLCSQLTRTRANVQHLSLQLHSQAKQSQRFAQETEQRSRMLVSRFQVALNLIQNCKMWLQTSPINVTDFEKQLVTVATCLHQGEREAEKQQLESQNACRGQEKVLKDEAVSGGEMNIICKSKLTDTSPSEDDTETVGKSLMRELFVVEQMSAALQSQHCSEGLSSITGEYDEDLAHRYENILSSRMVLESEKNFLLAGAECGKNIDLCKAIGRVCVEAELVHAACKCQQQYEGTTQVHGHEEGRVGEALADINPPELAPYDEQVPEENMGLKGAAELDEADDSDIQKVEGEKAPEWLETLVSRLQRRAKCLRQIYEEISDGNEGECRMKENWGNSSAPAFNCMLEQAKLIYLWNRLQLDLEQELEQSKGSRDKLQASCKDRDIKIKDEQEAFSLTLCQLQEDNRELREELEHAEEKIVSVETEYQSLLEDMQKIKNFHEERVGKVDKEFEEKIRELQQIHEDEMKRLHGFYTKGCVSKEKPAFTGTTAPPPDQTGMERRPREEFGNRMVSDESLSAMEEMHMKLIGELEHQHQKEVATLVKEKDQLLHEEMTATLTDIVAMRRAHQKEVEKRRQSQYITESADITQLHDEHEKYIKLLQMELELLSFQHTQTCHENSRLNQELEDERQSSAQCQKENQELKQKQRETDEVSQLHFLPNGKQSHVAQPNDFYEMEVILRAREAEMQFLRQEAHSLKEDLKIARMDKLYAQNKLKTLYTNSQDEPHHAVNNVCADLKSQSKDSSGQNPEETPTSKSNSAFRKKVQKSSLLRQLRGVRSKSLKEGLSVQERLKLFPSS